jgi:hypothetical protein
MTPIEQAFGRAWQQSALRNLRARYAGFAAASDEVILAALDAFLATGARWNAEAFLHFLRKWEPAE